MSKAERLQNALKAMTRRWWFYVIMLLIPFVRPIASVPYDGPQIGEVRLRVTGIVGAIIALYNVVPDFFVYPERACKRAPTAKMRRNERGQARIRNHAVRIGVLPLLCVALAVAGTAAQPESGDDVELSREERVLGLVTVYRAAEQHFAYFEQLPDLHWDKEFMKFLPLVEREQTLHEYYRVLQRFVALLQDGHTRVRFPDSLKDQLDRLPITLEVVEDQWVVVRRYPTREIMEEDIPRGSIVLSIDGVGPSEYFEKKFLPFIAAGRPEVKRANLAGQALYPRNSEVEITLRYPDGTTASRVLRANRKKVNWTDALLKRYGGPPEFLSKRLEGDVLYVRYGSCNEHCQSEFLKLIESLNAGLPAALVLDLRGNGGGSTPTRTVAGLISQSIPWFEYSTRWSASYIDAQLQSWSPSGESGGRELSEHLAARYGLPDRFSRGWYALSGKDSVIEPAETHYDGPVVILTDRTTASAAEDLVVLLQGAGRAVVAGEATFGSTGQMINFDLPGGGKVQICTVRTRYADGREFIDVGCRPDVPVRRTIKGITDGQDEVLDAALEHIRRSFPEIAPSQ